MEEREYGFLKLDPASLPDRLRGMESICYGLTEDRKCTAIAVFTPSVTDESEVFLEVLKAVDEEKCGELLENAEEALSDLGIRYIRRRVVGTAEEVMVLYEELQEQGYLPLSLNGEVHFGNEDLFVQSWYKDLQPEGVS